MLKQNLFSILSVCLLCLWSACDAPKEETTSKTPAPKEKPIERKPSQLVVEVDKLRLRDQAGENGKVIALLKKGERLTDLGEVSVSMQTITIRAVKYTEPWMKVKTAAGEEGWVFGGAVNFDEMDSSNAALKMRQRKLKTLFGDNLTQRILDYHASYQASNEEQSMATVYRTGTMLRDTLVEHLSNKIIYEDENTSPDLFWLDKMLPGFLVQLAAEGTVYYFYWNYKELAAKAKKSQGNADDEFMELCLKAHAVDSIEHFFPSWFLQTWDYGGNSLLGQGIHEKTLKYIAQIYSAEAIFAPEILEYKNKIINDITDKHIAYWEDQSKILAELDAIIEADFSFLSPEDKVALKTRRTMFADYKKNKIKLNVRAGH